MTKALRRSERLEPKLLATMGRLRRHISVERHLKIDPLTEGLVCSLIELDGINHLSAAAADSEHPA